MTEWEKGQKGYLYDANNDKEIVDIRAKCADLCYEYNQCMPSDFEKHDEIIHRIIGKIDGAIEIVPPFYCDYGFQISMGDNFYANHNCVIMDGAKVTFGRNVYIAPNCVISTAGHALDASQRSQGLEIALPITIGDDVWIGANSSILPGVHIGGNNIIGAGSVVNKDIPANVVAAGNPCKVIRKITDADKKRYPVWQESMESKRSAEL